MQHRSLQNNAFRTVTNLKALRSSSRSDNTFKGAKLAGVISGSSAPITIRTAGEVSKSDPVDIYKFLVQPGAYFPSSSGTYKITGGSLKVTAYLQHPDFTNNKIQQKHVDRLKGSSSRTDYTLTFNESFDPMVVYLKFTGEGKKTIKYDLASTYQPGNTTGSSNTNPSNSDFDDPFFNDPFFNDPFF